GRPEARWRTGHPDPRSRRDRCSGHRRRGPAEPSRNEMTWMTEAAEPPEVLTERRDSVLVITINRPAAKNAVTAGVATGIAAALDELDYSDELRAGVLTGAGGTFCAGMDLKGFLRGESPVVKGRGFAGLTMAPPRKPL